MHTSRLPRVSAVRLAALAAVACASLPAAAACRASDGQVAVVRAARWSPRDSVREGAGEFEVLFRVACLQREHRAAGLVAVGDRHGLFSAGGEHALRFIALRGVPVVRLAPGGELAQDPDGLFLDGGPLTESEAAAILGRCLDRLGPPPLATDVDHPTVREIAAIRAYLLPIREALALARAPRVTVR